MQLGRITSFLLMIHASKNIKIISKVKAFQSLHVRISIALQYTTVYTGLISWIFMVDSLANCPNTPF